MTRTSARGWARSWPWCWLLPRMDHLGEQLLLETTDAKGAPRRPSRRWSATSRFNQGRNFEDKKVGSTNVKAIEKVSNPQMQQSPVNPAICTYENYLVIGSGMEIVENILRPDAKKLSTAPGYIQAGQQHRRRSGTASGLSQDRAAHAQSRRQQSPRLPATRNSSSWVDGKWIPWVVSVGFLTPESVQLKPAFSAGK